MTKHSIGQPGCVGKPGGAAVRRSRYTDVAIQAACMAVSKRLARACRFSDCLPFLRDRVPEDAGRKRANRVEIRERRTAHSDQVVDGVAIGLDPDGLSRGGVCSDAGFEIGNDVAELRILSRLR